jgi:hypothetical protein
MLESTSSDIEPTVKIVLLAEAQRRFAAEDEWWRDHRDAKEIFIVELEQTLGLRPHRRSGRHTE